MHLRVIAPALLLLSVGCAEPDPSPEEAAQPGVETSSTQDAFWASLQALCGQAFSGRVVENNPPDEGLDSQPLVMHVRTCEPDVMRIPFFVGDDRSRTWVITRTADGLRLKHDHRHEDGSEDEVTQYGGDTGDIGSATMQDFAADELTAEMLPTSATNVWTVEVTSDVFAYALRRTGSDRRFRAEFDLTAPIDEPLPPWGAEGN